MLRELPDAARALAPAGSGWDRMGRPDLDIVLMERHPLSISELDLIQVHLSDTDRPVYSATIGTATEVSMVKLRFDPENGHVEMLDEKPADAASPLPRERFDGPLRLLARPDTE